MPWRIFETEALPQALLESCHKPTQMRGVDKGPRRKVSRGDDDMWNWIVVLSRAKLYSKTSPVNKRCAVEGRLRPFQDVRILDIYAGHEYCLTLRFLILSWCYLSRSFPYLPIYRFRGACILRWREYKPVHFRGSNPSYPTLSQISNVPLEPDIEAHINIPGILDNFHYFYRLPRTHSISQHTSRMPAPDITYRQIDARPALGHVWAHLIIVSCSLW